MYQNTGFVAENQPTFRVKLTYLITGKMFSGNVPDNSDESELWILLLFQVHIRYPVAFLFCFVFFLTKLLALSVANHRDHCHPVSQCGWALACAEWNQWGLQGCCSWCPAHTGAGMRYVRSFSSQKVQAAISGRNWVKTPGSFRKKPWVGNSAQFSSFSAEDTELFPANTLTSLLLLD